MDKKDFRENDKGTQSAIIKGNGNSVTQIIHIHYGTTGILCDKLDISHSNESPRKRLHITTDNPFREDVLSLQANITTATNWITKVQNDDWGMPANDKGTESCTWATAGLLYSSWIATGLTPPWWKSGLQWILSQCTNEGGAPFGLKERDFVVTDATALTLLCLSESGDKDFISYGDRMANWLINAQRKNGGLPWSLLSPQPNVISTGFAIISLKSYLEKLNEPKDEILQTINNGLEWLLSIRNPDGGWGSQDKDCSRPANTGFITYVFNTFSCQTLVDKSKMFLLNSYNANQGGWIDSLDRPVPHTVTRLGLPYTILGLSCLTRDKNVEQLINEGVKLIIKNFDGEAYCFPASNARTWPTRDFILACSSLLS